MYVVESGGIIFCSNFIAMTNTVSRTGISLL
jgi:hypothetical protein